MGSQLEVSWSTTRHHIHPHHISPFLFPPTPAPRSGLGMSLYFALILFPALAFAQDRYQTDLVDQYQNDPYLAGTIQSAYSLPDKKEAVSAGVLSGALCGGRKLRAKAICVPIRRH